MMIRLALIAALGLSACATNTTTSTAPAPVQVATAAPEQIVDMDDPNREVCKKRTRTGTRLGTSKVCRTQAEWDYLADVARKDFGEMTSNSAKSVK